ncbi:cytochrome P450 [Nocardia colli]|uniref:cytochrome P450 n=1 Tax=Nocardia colli TaxID=2545717 RepID=UPI0035DC2B35
MNPLESIPLAPGALPVLGHAVPLLRDPLSFLKPLHRYGDVLRVRLGPATAVAVCDPELTRRLLLEDDLFDKGGPIYDSARRAGGDSVLTCPYSRHRRQRRLVKPAFNPRRLPAYAEAMVAEINAVVSPWQDNHILDVSAEMYTLTSRILAATMFSDALPAPVQEQALADVATLLNGVYLQMVMPPPMDRLPIPANRRFREARSRLRGILEGVIAERRSTGADHGDLLSALLAVPEEDSDERGLSDVEIIDQVMTFFGAGTESTANTLTWALYLLAEHPEIERQVHAEVDDVLRGQPPVHADLRRLPVLNRVLTETLRLYPPGVVLTRVVTEDTDLGGYRLPAGTNVFYSPHLFHHRSDLYPHGDRFDPDRWLSDPAQTVARHNYVPFGFGARRCIGEQFALTEAMLALAIITARWTLRPLPGQNVQPALAATLRPRRLRMRVIAREVMAASGERPHDGPVVTDPQPA